MNSREENLENYFEKELNIIEKELKEKHSIKLYKREMLKGIDYMLFIDGKPISIDLDTYKAIEIVIKGGIEE